MANLEHLEKLYQDVGEWNRWREKNLKVSPDLTSADLSNTNLVAIDLSRADLSRANLSGTNLSMANLGGVNLGVSNLSVANLSREHHRPHQRPLPIKISGAQ